MKREKPLKVRIEKQVEQKIYEFDLAFSAGGAKRRYVDKATNNPAKKIGMVLAGVNLVIFLLVQMMLFFPSGEQGGFVWIFADLASFPICLLNYIYPTKAIFQVSSINLFDLIPYIVDGLLGPIWWYFVPQMLMSKENGGFWRK